MSGPVVSLGSQSDADVAFSSPSRGLPTVFFTTTLIQGKLVPIMPKYLRFCRNCDDQLCISLVFLHETSFLR